MNDVIKLVKNPSTNFFAPIPHAKNFTILREILLISDHNAYHLGQSLGICAGDVGFFLAFEILSKLKIKGRIYREILRLFSQEISYVGLAQMMDVYYGASKGSISEQDILKLYLYKTGRYTFSLPLMTGALLAEQPKRTLSIIFDLRGDPSRSSSLAMSIS